MGLNEYDLHQLLTFNCETRIRDCPPMENPNARRTRGFEEKTLAESALWCSPKMLKANPKNSVKGSTSLPTINYEIFR